MNPILQVQKALEKRITDNAALYSGTESRGHGPFLRRFSNKCQENGLDQIMAITLGAHDHNAPVFEARFLPYFTGQGERVHLEPAEIATCGRQQVVWRAYQVQLQKCVTILKECITPQLQEKVKTLLHNQPGQVVLDGRALAQRTLAYLKVADLEKRFQAKSEIEKDMNELPKGLQEPSLIRLWMVVYDLLNLELNELQFNPFQFISETNKVMTLISCLNPIGYNYNIQRIMDDYHNNYNGACLYLQTHLSRNVPIVAVPPAMSRQPLLADEVAVNYYASEVQEVNYTSNEPRCINCGQHSAWTICNKLWCIYCNGDWSAGQPGYHNFMNCPQRPGAIVSTPDNRVVPYPVAARAPTVAVRGGRSGGRAPLGRGYAQPARGYAQYGRGGGPPARGYPPAAGRGRGYYATGRGYTSINAMEVDVPTATDEVCPYPLVDDEAAVLQMQEDEYNAQYSIAFEQHQVNEHAVEQVAENSSSSSGW